MMKDNNFSKRKELLVQMLEKANPYQRFIILSYLAKTELRIGYADRANAYASELLSLAKNYKEDWNYGNAIHDANMVLGMVAITRGMVEEAKNYLLNAGDAPPSPRLNNFGPSMMLANALLKVGEDECVIRYLEKVRSIWVNDNGRLERWISSIKGGGHPYFGANLEF